MKTRGLTRFLLAAAAGGALLALTGCGGQPERYDDATNVSVFVWNQDAWAEHPGVVNEGDPGTPTSVRRRLIGKTMTLEFMVNGNRQVITVQFVTQLRCVVQTEMPNFINGMNNSNWSGNNYEYTVEGGDKGQEAQLTVNFLTDGGWLATVKTNLTYTSALQANASLQELRLDGDLTGAGINLIVPGQAGTVTWIVNN